MWAVRERHARIALGAQRAAVLDSFPKLVPHEVARPSGVLVEGRARGRLGAGLYVDVTHAHTQPSGGVSFPPVSVVEYMPVLEVAELVACARVGCAWWSHEFQPCTGIRVFARRSAQSHYFMPKPRRGADVRHKKGYKQRSARRAH